MSAWQSLIPVTIAAAVAFGLVLGLVGCLREDIDLRLKLDESGARGLSAAFHLSLVPMMFISGMLVDKLGVQGMLILGALITAVAVWALGLNATYHGAMTAAILLAVGGSCLSVGSIVLMPRAFFDNTCPAAALNVGYVFVSLGALVAWPLIDVLSRRPGLRKTTAILGFLCLVSAATAMLTDRAAFPAIDRQGDLWTMLHEPALWLAALVLLLYIPLEGATGSWAAAYFKEQGFSVGKAKSLFAGFWISFLFSRLGLAFLQQHSLQNNSEPWALLGMAVLATVALGNLAGTHDRHVSGLVFLLLGAALGPIVPTLVGFVFNEFPPNEQGTAYGALYAIGGTGNLVLSLVIGRYARRAPVRMALRIPTFIALVLGCVCLALAAISIA